MCLLVMQMRSDCDALNRELLREAENKQGKQADCL